jgi:hypothetical protein
MAVRTTYQQMHQGHNESIIAYKKRFNFALKLYHEQGNPELKDPDVAMDFFRGLDNVRYATFKTEFLNGLSSSAIKKPQDLNAIFMMANQRLKPKVTTSSFASTSTTLDHVERPEDPNDKGKRTRKGKCSQNKNGKNVGKDTETKCFVCDEPGHYENKCPHKKKQTQESDADESEIEDRHGHVTWDASTFVTYHNVMNIAAMSKFKRTEVLLDNQVDVSVVPKGTYRTTSLSMRVSRQR